MTSPDLSQIREIPVRTPVDLENLWRALMGGGGFGRRTLWLTFLGRDGLPVPMIVPIEDIPRQPDLELVRSLAITVEELVDDDDLDSAVLLVSRPGPSAMTADDRAWARALAPLSRWSVHLATADHLQVFAPDDLLPEASSARR